MNILLAYSSLTGNTEYYCKEAIKDIKEEYNIDVLTVKETKNYDDYDLIIVGFWVDKGTANKEAKKFIQKIKNKKVALLGTLGAAPDSEHGLKVVKNVGELVDPSNEYLGVRLARGKVAEKLIKRIKILPLPRKIKDQMYEASIHSREPNAEEIREANNFVKNCLKQ